MNLSASHYNRRVLLAVVIIVPLVVAVPLRPPPGSLTLGRFNLPVVVVLRASPAGGLSAPAGSDSESGEVGGLQNTVTNLGASIGTALSGAVLIATLSSTLAAGIQQNPAVPSDLKAKAQTQLASGVPFLSDKDLQAALNEAGVPKATADAVVQENSTARIAALRSSLSVIAIIALVALFFSLSIPERQPAAARDGPPGEDAATPEAAPLHPAAG